VANSDIARAFVLQSIMGYKFCWWEILVQLCSFNYGSIYRICTDISMLCWIMCVTIVIKFIIFMWTYQYCQVTMCVYHIYVFQLWSNFLSMLLKFSICGSMSCLSNTHSVLFLSIPLINQILHRTATFLLKNAERTRFLNQTPL
jgi:hypothetical protein